MKEREDKIRFKDAIKHMRESAGYTQTELANKLQIPQQTFSAYERNHNKPTLEMVTKVADACDFQIIIADKESSEQLIIE